MIKLNEEMVVARTRISDLLNVKKLNCWGADIQDVSLLRKMPNVEVLALSVNQIRTLADFQYCYQLQELYIRKNDIRDLRDVCYLKGLTKLKNLWLADNPCSQVEGYRLAVLKALPQLEKLDDVIIRPDELQEAACSGYDLVLPSEEHDVVVHSVKEAVALQNNYEVPRAHPVQKELPVPSERTLSPTVSPRNIPRTPPPPSEFHQESNKPNTVVEDSQFSPVVTDEPAQLRRASVASPGSVGHVEKRAQSESAPASRRSSYATTFSPVTEHPVSHQTPVEQPSPSRCPIHNPSTYGPCDHQDVHHTESIPQNSFASQSPSPTSMAAPPASELHGFNDVRNNYMETRPFRMTPDIPPRNSPTSYANNPAYFQGAAFNNATNSGQMSERCSPTRSRTRSRASNLLMAALCLVNELDYGSLEVLGMAVRNRLDELDGN